MGAKGTGEVGGHIVVRGMVAAGGGGMALPADQYDVPGILPGKAQHLQLVVGDIGILPCAGFPAAVVDAEIAAVVADIVADEGHVGDQPLAEGDLCLRKIRNGLRGGLCHLLAVVGQVAVGTGVLPAVHGRTGMGVGGGDGDLRF